MSAPAVELSRLVVSGSPAGNSRVGEQPRRALATTPAEVKALRLVADDATRAQNPALVPALHKHATV